LRSVADGCSSVLVAIADLAFGVAALALDGAGAASFDRVAAILLPQPEPLGSALASMLACGDKG
jgi:hypothetical protein